MTPGEILDEIQKLPWEDRKVIQARLNNMIRGVRQTVTITRPCDDIPRISYSYLRDSA